MPEGADGVYISRWHHGSPAHRYGLFALHWITEINGTPTTDLDTFLDVTRTLPDGAFVRVKVCHLETTKPKVRGRGYGAGVGGKSASSITVYRGFWCGVGCVRVSVLFWY